VFVNATGEEVSDGLYFATRREIREELATRDDAVRADVYDKKMDQHLEIT
jgi:hypothetical protein